MPRPFTLARSLSWERILLAFVLALILMLYRRLTVLQQRELRLSGTRSASAPTSRHCERVQPFGHPYYRYSVVPGGAHSADELRRAAGSDEVIGSHFADFDLASARTFKLEHDLSAYVSYRRGDRIFWTRHPVLLRRGEEVLTDGSHIIRTRCGNRVSKLRQEPVVTMEPKDVASDAPVPVISHDFSAPEAASPSWSEPQLDVAPYVPVDLGSPVAPALPQFPNAQALVLPLPDDDLKGLFAPVPPNQVAIQLYAPPQPVSAAPDPRGLGLAGLIFMGAGLACTHRKRRWRSVRQ